MKKLLLILVLALMFNGCAKLKLDQAVADANDPKVVKAFEKKINEAIKVIQADPTYVRIPLDTKEDIDWFTSLTFLYWDKKISRGEYIAEGLKKFPDYEASFNVAANLLKQ